MGKVAELEGKNKSINQVGFFIGSLIAKVDRVFNGAAGAFVTNTNVNRIGILSCWHVMSGRKGRIDDPIRSVSINNKDIHYGTVIGKLGPAVLNDEVDAAVAWLLPEFCAKPIEKGATLVFSGVREPKLGEVLTKIGGKTGKTRARVTSIARYPVRFSDLRINMLSMILEPLYESHERKIISVPGDCGSVWFSEESLEAIGLHYAGEDNSAYGPIHAKACFMTHVLDALDVELYVPS